MLTVEDFAPHRELISSLLSQREGLKMICEVSDGWEAVRKAVEILLDIGLSELNEIAAARQILKLAPHSRIVFVTQESSPEAVEETTRLGAYRYVLMTRFESKAKLPPSVIPYLNATPLALVESSSAAFSRPC